MNRRQNLSRSPTETHTHRKYELIIQYIALDFNYGYRPVRYQISNREYFFLCSPTELINFSPDGDMEQNL